MPVPTEKLERPSVIEAVCEFRFTTGVSYTLVAGAMNERLKSRFPSSEVLPTAFLMGGIPEEIVTPQIPHHRFRSQSPNALVQTGPRLLTVNVLPIYPGFEVFRELILFVLEQYEQVAQSGNASKIGLRYINHFPQSTGRNGLSNYFKLPISYPTALPHPPGETAVRFVLPYPDLGTLGLAIAFPARTGTGESGALLDLDFSWTKPSDLDLKEFPDWLDKAHEVIYTAFTSIVLDDIMAEMKGGGV